MRIPNRGREEFCNHYNGTVNKCCDVNVAYDDVVVPMMVTWSDGSTHVGKAYPCFEEGDKYYGGTCDKRQMPTEAEVAEREAAIKFKSECIARGISDCCQAPIDKSHVIASGRYKGHGRRFCSKCGKLLFMV